MPVSTSYQTKTGVTLNDTEHDGELGELIRSFSPGKNGFFNLQSALRRDIESDGSLPQDDGIGFASFLQHDNVDKVITGLRIKAVDEDSKLGETIGADGKEFSTPTYAVMVQDDDIKGAGRSSVFSSGDFAQMQSNPYAWDDGGDYTNGAKDPDGTGGAAVAVLKDVSGGVIGTRFEDHMIGGKGGDFFGGGNGDDVLQGGGGNDRLLGGRGDDNIAGGKQGDQIRGGTGDDLLRGGDRFGKFGPDASDNFGQRDTFVFESVNNGHDRITDFGLSNGDNPADKLAFRLDNTGKVELSAELTKDGDGDGNADLEIFITNFVGTTGSVRLDGIDTVEEVKEVFDNIHAWQTGTADFINPLDHGYADDLFIV